MSDREQILRWEDSGGAMVVSAADYDALLTELEQAERLIEPARVLVRLNLAPDIETLAWIPGREPPLEVAAEYDGALAKLRDALDGLSAEKRSSM